jgi:nicotinamide riboside kinase
MVQPRCPASTCPIPILSLVEYRYQVHLVVTPTELDILVDTLRSVGNTELADRLENILRQFGQAKRRDRDA